MLYYFGIVVLLDSSLDYGFPSSISTPFLGSKCGKQISNGALVGFLILGVQIISQVYSVHSHT
jgi:hypothetical protein